jgi:holin-like protein
MMPALQGLALLLLAQSAGELLVRALRLPLPGPVLGMGLVLAALAWAPTRRLVAGPVEAVAELLLAHLSLLFVPLGVGVIAHLGLLGEHAGALAVVLLLSTVAGLAVTALVLQALWRDDATADAAEKAAEPAP